MGKNITQLHPVLQVKAAQLKELCAKQGLKMGIGECFRTVAEQDLLYEKGRTIEPIGKSYTVTNARGSTYSSQHQWGIAFDFYENKKGHEFEDISFFNQVGGIGKAIGLGWGGDWKSPVDKAHLYLPDWGDTPGKLKSQYGTLAEFQKTWGTMGYSNDSAGDLKSADTEVKNNIKTGQQHANHFANAQINLDGIRGTQTKRAGIKVLQQALNLDYQSGLTVDGIWGKKSEAALGNHTVRKGERQYLVTAAEILLLLKNYNSGGVETPGIFGNGLKTAVRQFQLMEGLSIDGIVGKNTFKTLIL
ncbi:MAG: peptidoglycan-binding protein [Lachnospiraceae bacterium]